MNSVPIKHVHALVSTLMGIFWYFHNVTSHRVSYKCGESACYCVFDSICQDYCAEMPICPNKSLNGPKIDTMSTWK